jgi:hypothetical protein
MFPYLIRMNRRDRALRRVVRTILGVACAGVWVLPAPARADADVASCQLSHMETALFTTYFQDLRKVLTALEPKSPTSNAAPRIFKIGARLEPRPSTMILSTYFTGINSNYIPYPAATDMPGSYSGGAMLVFHEPDKSGAPGRAKLRIGGAGIPEIQTYYGIISVGDKLIANGTAIKVDDLVSAVHDHRLRVLKKDLDNDLVFEGYAWSQAGAFGKTDSSFGHAQFFQGAGIGLSWRPGAEAARWGSLVNLSVSAGPGVHFGIGETASPPRLTGGGFVYLTGIR